MRTIYVHPDEYVRIRVVRNADLPLTHEEWKYQVRPTETKMWIRKQGQLSFTAGCVPDIIHETLKQTDQSPTSLT